MTIVMPNPVLRRFRSFSPAASQGVNEKSVRCPLLLLAVLSLTGSLFAQNTCNWGSVSCYSSTSSLGSTPLQATSANVFIDSIGVNVHLNYPSYSNYSVVKNALVNLGIRHIRMGGTDSATVGKIQDLAQSAIKSNFVISPTDGIVPNANYWSVSPNYTVPQFLKNIVGPGVIESVEECNEFDLNYGGVKWHPSDTTNLSGNSSSPLYFVSYLEAFTQDTWSAIKSDPLLASIKVIGPSTVTAPLPAGALFGYVDWGNFHPYVGGGNTSSNPGPYGGVQKYYWQTNQPNLSIDEWPIMFIWFQPLNSSSAVPTPMAATELGYQTGTSAFSVSQTTFAKYVPRIFAEDFRDGITRSFLYELVDEGTDQTNREQNFGLLYNNWTPKPAYTALQSLIGVLADTGPAFTPSKLNYSIAAAPVGAYTRTQYVHDLLLQKSNGDFYLLLWHEVASAAIVDASGNPLTSTDTDLAPPALPTTISLPAQISQATLYSYGAGFTYSATPLTITNHQVVVPASDAVSVIQLH
jgi:hypothetical protein